jgi:hypothetical protein
LEVLAAETPDPPLLEVGVEAEIGDIHFLNQELRERPGLGFFQLEVRRTWGGRPQDVEYTENEVP